MKYTKKLVWGAEVILKDGEMMTSDEIIEDLNSKEKTEPETDEPCIYLLEKQDVGYKKKFKISYEKPEQKVQLQKITCQKADEFRKKWQHILR